MPEHEGRTALDPSVARTDDREVHADYLRSVVFGCEDGIVSTTGAVVGIAVGTDDAEVVVLAGIVIVLVEALSMGAGQLLSERSVHQLDPSHTDSVLRGAALMAGSYLVAGAVPLVPIVVVREVGALWIGAALALACLFVLGVVKAHLVGVARIRSGLEILAVGGSACALGIATGLIFRVS